LKSNIKRAHPYEVPEIVEVRMNKVSKSYLSWLAESTNKIEKKKQKSRRNKRL
jgi:periplasmic divalent cation tolerance protein